MEEVEVEVVEVEEVVVELEVEVVEEEEVVEVVAEAGPPSHRRPRDDRRQHEDDVGH